MTESTDPNVPTVMLAGQKWQVAELVPRQLRHIRGTLLNLNRAIGKAGSFLQFANGLSNDEYDSLLDVAYWGLTRGTGMPREEFLDLKISDAELFNAFFTVRDQSGLFTSAPNGESGGDAGEATAEVTRDQNQTGIISS